MAVMTEKQIREYGVFLPTVVFSTGNIMSTANVRRKRLQRLENIFRQRVDLKKGSSGRLRDKYEKFESYILQSVAECLLSGAGRVVTCVDLHSMQLEKYRILNPRPLDPSDCFS